MVNPELYVWHQCHCPSIELDGFIESTTLLQLNSFFEQFCCLKWKYQLILFQFKIILIESMKNMLSYIKYQKDFDEKMLKHHEFISTNFRKINIHKEESKLWLGKQYLWCFTNQSIELKRYSDPCISHTTGGRPIRDNPKPEVSNVRKIVTTVVIFVMMYHFHIIAICNNHVNDKLCYC